MVTVVGVIALAMIMSTIVTSDVFADTKRDRANKNLERHIESGGENGKKAQEIKDKLNRNPSHPHGNVPHP